MTSNDTRFAKDMNEVLKQKDEKITPTSDLKKNTLTPEEHYKRLRNLRINEEDAREISGYEKTV